MQNNINRKAAKISVLASSNIYKYDDVTTKEILLSNQR